MGMTIDEIIKREDEIYIANQRVVDTHIVDEDIDLSIEELYCDDTEVIDEQLANLQLCAEYHKQIVDTMRKYQMMQADYNARLKADMVAMLTEIQMELEENKLQYMGSGNEVLQAFVDGLTEGTLQIQKKIDKLKEVEHGNDD